MSINVVMQKLGVINRNIGIAPFQIPLSLPGWATPMFVNGTGSVGVSPAFTFGGYWGLNYVYTNGQFSKNPNNSFNLVGANQIAGGSVQSFGIFDFYAGPSANGVHVSPYGGGAIEDGTQTNWAQGPNSLYAWRNTATSGGSWPSYITVANFPLPNVMFGRTIQKAMNPDITYTYATNPPLAGSLFTQPTPVFIPPVYLRKPPSLLPPATAANVNFASPLTAGSQICVQPIVDPFGVGSQGMTNAASPYLVQTGPVPIQPVGVILAAINTFLWSLTFSPKYNAYGGMWNGTGLFITPLYTATPYLNQSNTQIQDQSVIFTLSDPADQADLTTFQLGGWTTAPDGNFWARSPINANTFYIISPKGVGYYKVIFSGPALYPNYAGGGYGIDTSGNFWGFTTVAGQLASTLGFPSPPIFPPFPQVSASWVGCRRNMCAYPWYG